MLLLLCMHGLLLLDLDHASGVASSFSSYKYKEKNVRPFLFFVSVVISAELVSNHASLCLCLC